MSSPNIFNNYDIVFEILQRSTQEDYVCLSVVSKLFHTISTDNLIWEKYFRNSKYCNSEQYVEMFQTTKLIECYEKCQTITNYISVDEPKFESPQIYTFCTPISFWFNLDKLTFVGALLGNKYNNILPASIDVFVNLTSLNLCSNKLTNLGDGLFKLTRLRRLELSDNQITTICHQFQNLTKLEELFLAHNCVSNITILCNLTSLTRLDISYNQLTDLPSQMSNLTNLVNLDLMSCNLFNLPNEISALTELQSLDISANNLSEFPPSMKNLLNLQTLFTLGNKFENYIPPFIYDNVTVLKYLSV